MRVFRDKEGIAGKIVRPVVTVGSFDGLHAGHRQIVDRLNRIARETGGESVVVTFDPHPRQVLSDRPPEPFLINSTEEKLALMEQAGVENVLVVPFTREFAALSPSDFLSDYLVDAIGARVLLMGYNHHFGRNREGDRNLLDGRAGAYGVRIVEVPAWSVEEGNVSSTAVREVIRRGDMARARKLLTAPFLMIGTAGPEGVFEYRIPGKILPPPGDYPVTVRSKEQGTAFDSVLHLAEGGGMHLFPLPDSLENRKVTVYIEGNRLGRTAPEC